jgi:rapamycin-insensitive companion of mTOR
MDKDKDQYLAVLKLLRELSSKADDRQLEHLKELVKRVKGLEGSPYLAKVSIDTTFWIFKRYLLTEKGSVKVKSLVVLRYLLVSRDVCQAYCKQHVPLLVAYAIEKDERGDVEALREEQIEGIKLIRRWTEVDGQNLPKMLANSLISFLDETDDYRGKVDDRLKNYGIEVVRQLAEKNVELCAWCGGFRVMLDAVTNPVYASKSEMLVSFMLTVLNDPESRAKVGCYLNFPRLFSVFTDIDHEERDSGKEARRLELARKALIVILKSWHGIIYLGEERTCLVSLVESLRHPIRPATREAIFLILEELFSLANKLSDGTTNNTSVQGLLKCFLVVLIQLLLDCDIFKILVELSGLEDPDKSVPAQKFLKQLTTIMFNTIPNSSKFTDFLISAASHKSSSLEVLKSCSLSVVNTMGNYIFEP